MGSSWGRGVNLDAEPLESLHGEGLEITLTLLRPLPSG